MLSIRGEGKKRISPIVRLHKHFTIDRILKKGHRADSKTAYYVSWLGYLSSLTVGSMNSQPLSERLPTKHLHSWNPEVLTMCQIVASFLIVIAMLLNLTLSDRDKALWPTLVSIGFGYIVSVPRPCSREHESFHRVAAEQQLDGRSDEQHGATIHNKTQWTHQTQGQLGSRTVGSDISRQGGERFQWQVPLWAATKGQSTHQMHSEPRSLQLNHHAVCRDEIVSHGRRWQGGQAADRVQLYVPCTSHAHLRSYESEDVIAVKFCDDLVTMLGFESNHQRPHLLRPIGTCHRGRDKDSAAAHHRCCASPTGKMDVRQLYVIQAMLLWLILPFYRFWCFKSVAVNSPFFYIYSCRSAMTLFSVYSLHACIAWVK